MISEAEFKEWLESPVTKALREFCDRRREELRRDWERTLPSDYLKETYVMDSVRHLGSCEAFKMIQGLEFEQLLGDARERD